MAVTVEQWDTLELAYEADRDYANPFVDVALTGRVSAPRERPTAHRRRLLRRRAHVAAALDAHRAG